TMAIRSGGPSPTFVDIDETTGNIDLDALAEKLMIPSSRGKNIVVPVHFAGLPVDMERLGNMPLSPDDIIIEDGSHALGSSYEKNGPLVGSCVYSDMTVFSFHPAKTITTGEGGMVTTNNEAMAQRLRLFRNNGIVRDCPDSPGPWYHEVVDATGNYNMTDISAALGVSQLKKIDLFIKKRRKITSWYHEDLEGVKNLSFLEIPQENTVSPHLFVVKIDFEACKTTRKAVMERLHDEGIGSQVLYIPLYQQPYFKNILGDISTDFPNMERYYSQTLALPLHCNIERSDVSRISSTIKKILNAN
ncbi:MAG: UDP-4-amino-4,6-dideoxy-N-acetyl-beta-L-altrosamine transaminase, partial [Waddliaceae bacterium]|nr:UDP-4-amino-4,6-dideoxy-N-acetyl-beta-L-altrosamine transaminase [Waddliaceae bacterium]